MGIPIPVSPILTLILLHSFTVKIVMVPPAGVNFTEFFSKFQKT